jgi:short-subunit dehydrogenase
MSNSSHSSTVMITGATGGLGQSLARRLARERDFDNVVLAVRNAERGTALRDSLQAQFPSARFAVSQTDQGRPRGRARR